MSTRHDSIAGKLLTLKGILAQVSELHWRHALYASERRGNLSLTTPAAVLDPNDVESEDPEADPEFARQHGLRYLLMVQDLRGILGNAEDQLGRPPTQDELLRALEYYLAHDAYPTFSRGRR